MASCSCLFWTVWKERNRRAFDNEGTVQGLKLSFLCNIWAWTKVYIVFGPSSIVNFVDLLDSVLGGIVFCSPFSFFRHS